MNNIFDIINLKIENTKKSKILLPCCNSYFFDTTYFVCKKCNNLVCVNAINCSNTICVFCTTKTNMCGQHHVYFICDSCGAKACSCNGNVKLNGKVEFHCKKCPK